MRTAILSANLGDFDFHEPPKKQTVEFDYFLFNDDNFPPRVKAMAPRLQAKIPKFFGWQLKPDYDYYLWIDGNIELTKRTSLEWLLNKCKDSEIAVFKHPRRPNIRQEARYLRKGINQQSNYIVGRYDFEWTPQQVAVIEADRNYEDDLLILGGVFLYKNTPQVQAMLKEWWYMTTRYSVFDQIAFPYVLKKSGVRYSVIDEDINFCSHLKLKKHRYHTK